jgi:transposase
MLDLHAVKSRDLKALSTTELTELASQMLAHIGEQSKHIDAQDKQAQGIKWRDAKIESITFQLAKLKAWRFGAKTERMNAEQRDIFEETFAADQASLEAQLAALQGSTPNGSPGAGAPEDKKRRQPKREALPEHLPRVDQRIEPEDTHCPTPECGKPMVRVGEDISERQANSAGAVLRAAANPRQVGLQVLPVAGAGAGRPAGLRQRVANAWPASPHPISRFVDHIPYYRQEQINARSGVHTPRSTLAAWSGQTGAQLMPLYDAHRAFILSSRIVHADETPISMLDPGAGKTKKAYMWAYARGAFDPQPGVVFDFCLGRGGKYPTEFLKGWTGTLVVDAYGGYDGVLSLEGRSTAYCLAHARRKFDELIKTTPKASPVAAEAIQRIAWLYKIEADARQLSCEERLHMRLERFLSRCGINCICGSNWSARACPTAVRSPRRLITA